MKLKESSILSGKVGLADFLMKILPDKLLCDKSQGKYWRSQSCVWTIEQGQLLASKKWILLNWKLIHHKQYWAWFQFFMNSEISLKIWVVSSILFKREQLCCRASTSLFLFWDTSLSSHFKNWTFFNKLYDCERSNSRSNTWWNETQAVTDRRVSKRMKNEREGLYSMNKSSCRLQFYT